MPSLAAVIFDLFGTLVELRDRCLLREVPRLLGVPGRRWVHLVWERVLTSRFDDARSFAEFVCVALTGRAEAEHVAAVEALAVREVASVAGLEGVAPTIQFLRRRGVRVGVLSNASSLHAEAVHRLGLEALLDAQVFSCDERRAKPDPALYLTACERLGAEPARVVMIGDSPRADVEAPARLGIRSLRAGGGSPSAPAVAGWLALDVEAPAALLEVGHTLNFLGERLVVRGLAPVADIDQGRYNLVFVVTCSREQAGAGEARRLFAKRYLQPEGAHVEALGYLLQGMAGLPSCAAAVIESAPEPWLLVTPAPGEPFAGDLDPEVVERIGAHFAFGYVFANADLRPRNALLDRGGGAAVMTMVDLEYCFLNLAIPSATLPDAFDRPAVEALGRERLRSLVRRRVLTDRTLPRARAEFLGAEDRGAWERAAFTRGFLAAFEVLLARRSELIGELEARLDRPPWLVIGTHAYRRAMLSLDVEDIRSRLDENPRDIVRRMLE
ncbi:MAG: HAD-IA family hydrolase [Acidobacteriota bacterium]